MCAHVDTHVQVWEVVRMKQAAPAADERLLSVEEAADVLGVSRWQIYELMKRPGPDGLRYVQGKARSGKPGYRKVEPAEIRRYIADNRVAP